MQIVFKFGKSTLTSNLPLNDMTLENLRSIVMNKWDDFYRKEFHLEYEDVASKVVEVVDDELLASLVKSAGVNFTVISDCCGFSEYKKEADYLGIERIELIEGVTDFPRLEFDIDQWKDQIDHAVKDIMNKIQLYGPINQTCEASVREHISPVLSLAALIAGDIKMRAEQRICGLRGTGPLEYLCLYRRFPMAVTEVKDEDLDQGVAQNDAQLVASRQDYKFKLHKYLVDDDEIQAMSKKRKYLEIDLKDIPSFGIVSSGLIWILQKFIEGANGARSTIFKSKPMLINLLDGTEQEIKEQMLEVARHIVGILTIQKDLIDAHPNAKRVRN